MKTITRTLTLRSEEHYGKRVPPQAFGEILRTFPRLLRGSVRMSFEGRSAARGRRPRWLEAASDIRFVDHNGDDETVLYFETPMLGEAVAELYEQQELWPSRPDPEDTPFDLLADVVEDVRSGLSDSDRFDRPLLTKLHDMGRGLNGTFQSCLVSSRRHADGPRVTVDRAVVTSADELTRATPQPRQIRIAGVLDMIRASTNTIGVKLDNGQEIRGVLVHGDTTQIHELLNRKVTLLGKAIYRPSGNLLRVDVAEVRSMRNEDAFFNQIPTPQRSTKDRAVIMGQRHRTSNVAAIIGRWPGEETDAEIELALQELS
ncbi:MAG: hypothetical protein JJU36_03640 [Phycisphaeraceae bacterium]|nr:hypothetical protein [Phycisphaeraceae bacterium]